VKEKDEIIIVEGYIDVIAFNLLGFSNVASPSGTALTSQQLEQLSKYSSNITISFDNDDAGINATNRILEIKNSTSRDLYLKCMTLPEGYKDIGEYYEDGKEDLELLLSNKIDLIEFSINSLIKKEDTGDKRIIFSEFKNLIKSLSPLDQDYAFDILSVKINTPKDLLVKELKHKKSSPTYGESTSSQNESNKHIEAFQDIFISSLIKNEFEDVSEFEDLLNSSEELFNIIKKLQSGQNKDISNNFINISFTEYQLQEAISRLYIHYFEIKINTLISELEVSNDTNIFSEIENIKKKIEIYQSTL
jgi:DNA primase